MKPFVLSFILCLPTWSLNAQAFVKLYNGPAPGSETWNYVEGNTRKYGAKVTYNVTIPSLLIFYPEVEASNGKAIILAPGGNFHLLKIEQEGTTLAMQLATRGFTVFVLKYRTIYSASHNPLQDFADTPTDTLTVALKKILPLATADGLAAVHHVRTHAGQYRIDPDKIALVGFSAGASLGLLVVQSADAHSAPNFVGSIAPLNLACDELGAPDLTASHPTLRIYPDQPNDQTTHLPAWLADLTVW